MTDETRAPLPESGTNNAAGAALDGPVIAGGLSSGLLRESLRPGDVAPAAPTGETPRTDCFAEVTDLMRRGLHKAADDVRRSNWPLLERELAEAKGLRVTSDELLAAARESARSATQRIEPERVAEALKVKKHEWENADPELLEPWYSHWVQQLTEQGLHSKADIATVLAILSQHAEDSAHDSLRLHRDKMALIDEKIAARSTSGSSDAQDAARYRYLRDADSWADLFADKPKYDGGTWYRATSRWVKDKLDSVIDGCIATKARSAIGTTSKEKS